jgi:hypothetical protein
MTTLLRVEGAKGGNGAPAVRQITRVSMVGPNCGRTKIGGRACEYHCEVALKVSTAPIKKGCNMYPCCETRY